MSGIRREVNTALCNLVLLGISCGNLTQEEILHLYPGLNKVVGGQPGIPWGDPPQYLSRPGKNTHQSARFGFGVVEGIPPRR